MLKHPVPTRARRTIGFALIAMFGLGGAFVAWAASVPGSSPPPAVAAAAGSVVDAQIRVSVNGGASQSLRMVNPVGEPFAASGGSAADAWRAQFVARPVAGGAIELAAKIERAGAVIAEPLLVVEPNEPASLVVGDPGKPEQLRLEATLALHAAGWKPPAGAM